MKVEILVVGDEILSGTTVDTNSGEIARALAASGHAVGRITQVGDRAEGIVAAAREALQRAPILIVSGGLGPTPDDLTKEALAPLFDDVLELDAPTLAEIRARFARRGLVMPEVNRKQALLPRQGGKIPNPVGSAPGVHWQRQGADVYLLPGVPAELIAMLAAYVVPDLARRFPGTAGRVAVFRTAGVAESVLVERLQPAFATGPELGWAFYPGRGGVDVQVRQNEAAPAMFDAACNLVRQQLAECIYTEEPETSLAEVVKRAFVARNLKLAVAESCTGGLLGARLTAEPGSSSFFLGGFVTYDNAAKRDWLGVPAALLEAEGAVSAAVAAAMARGARERAGADRGLGVTGIAGPTGGTAEKPVGLVFLGLATPDGVWTRRLQLGTDRDLNRELACTLALDMLRRHELGLEVGERA